VRLDLIGPHRWEGAHMDRAGALPTWPTGLQSGLVSSGLRSLMKSKVFNMTLSLDSHVRTQGLLTTVSGSELGDPLLVTYSFA
jgi:hypothetical protein